MYAAADFRRDAPFRGLGRQKGARFGETLAMFKLPAYDPFAIMVMGFGILLAAILMLAFVA